jgi:hypothetical protein
MPPAQKRSKGDQTTVAITSWEELRARVSELLAALNGDTNLAIAAAANPILALEELGYQVAAESRRAIEDRFRFSYRKAARLRALRRELTELAGRPIDIDSADDVRKLLVEDLRVFDSKSVSLKQSGGCRTTDRSRDKPSAPVRSSFEPMAVQTLWAEPAPDPLEPWRGTHPIMIPLLEYRQLDASEPRLAPSDLYQELRAGRRKSPIVGIRGRLRNRGGGTEEGADA